MGTTIEWTATANADGTITKGRTWNPTTGCTKISAGCKFCYAKPMHGRLNAMERKKPTKATAHYSEPFEVVRTHSDFLDLPRTWKKPTKVFVNSMSDLFHEDIPMEFIQAVFKVMNETPQHTYQILTKRSARLRKVSPELNWTANIWMGVSVESDLVHERIGDLLHTGAVVKWLSIEPLINRLSLYGVPFGDNSDGSYLAGNYLNTDTGNFEPYPNGAKIGWCVVGGESGPKKTIRPMKREWVYEIQRECTKHGVPFFFKQWGSPRNNPDPNDPTMVKGHPDYAKGGCQIDGKIYHEYPEQP